MPEKTYLDDAAEFAYKELEKVGGDPAKLPIPLQTLAVLYTVQAMIDNGGFKYIFENDYPFNPPYSMFSDAYRRIGATEAAERLDKAVSMFPFENPHLNQPARLKFMEALDEEADFFTLGDQVCGDENIWVRMEDYAKKHGEAFHTM